MSDSSQLLQLISGYYSFCLVRSQGEKKRLEKEAKEAKAAEEKKQNEVKEEQQQQEAVDDSWLEQYEEEWEEDAEAYVFFSNVNSFQWKKHANRPFCFLFSNSFFCIPPECSQLTGMVKLATLNDTMVCSGIYAFMFPNLDDLFRGVAGSNNDA